eukprot:3627604-Alexandrium_andersonii.AAC.1
MHTNILPVRSTLFRICIWTYEGGWFSEPFALAINNGAEVLAALVSTSSTCFINIALRNKTPATVIALHTAKQHKTCLIGVVL